MTEKTIKVDEAVHKRLEEMKGKYGVETFNEVLRHQLGIVSSPNVEQLAAYLQDELKQTAEEIVNNIREIGEFKETVTESGRREVLEFICPDSNTLIASIQFDEKSFQVKYRSQSGDMKDCGRGYCRSSADPSYGRTRNTSNSTEPQDVIDQVNKKVTGSYNRWGK